MGNERKKTYNEKMNNKAVRAAFWFVICNVLQRGIQFLYIPWYTRVLSPDGYGRYASFLTWGNILSVFATLNLCHAVFSNGMMEYKDRRREYLSSMYGLAFVTSLITFLFFFPLNNLFSNYTNLEKGEIIVLFVGVFFQMVVLLWGAYERFEFRYKSLISVTIVVAVLNPLISMVLFFFTDCGYYSFVLGYVLPNVLVGGILIIGTLKHGVKLYDIGCWKFALLLAVPLIPHYLSNHILNQSDRLMIRYFWGDQYAGIYSLAYQVSFAVSLVYYGVNNSVAPWTYRMLEASNEIYIKQVIRKLFVPCLYVSLVIMLFSSEIIEICGSNSFIEASYIIPDLVVATYIMFANILILNILFYFKKNKWVVLATTVGAVSNIVLNLILLPVYGYQIACTTTVIGFFIIFIINGFSLRKFDNKAYPFGGTIITTLILFVLGRLIISLNVISYGLMNKLLIMCGGTVVLGIVFRKQIIELYSIIIYKENG